MSYIENALVIHRVGSNEGQRLWFVANAIVIHRVGSNEETSIEPLRVS